MFEANLCFSMIREYSSDFCVDNHTHDCYEIVYYIEGTGISKIQDTEYAYSENTFCVIPPNTAHSERTTSPVKLFYVGFNYDGQMGKLPTGLLKDDEEKTISNLLSSIQKELHGQNLHYDLQLSLLQKQLIITLLRWEDKTSIVPKRSRDCMNYAMNFINSNFSTQISMEKLADSVGYSYHHFRHIFKETYGISPKQYVLKVRMNHAKILLQRGELSVKEVSQMCGFKSTSQFINVFKKHTDLSPLAYKQASGKYEERAKYEQ